MKHAWGRIATLLICLLLSIAYIIPTFFNLDLEKTKFPIKEKMNLGLDLQGGLYMVLGVDFDQVFKNTADRQLTSLQSRAKDKGIALASGKLVTEGMPKDDPRIRLEFPAAQKAELSALIKKEFWSLRLTTDEPAKIELGLSLEYRGEIRERTLNQSIEVIRNRIDEFGVSEPSITSQGTDRVVVELPGVKEVDRAKDLIGRTAKLEFKIVDDQAKSPEQLAQLIGQLEKDSGIAYKEGGKFSEYVTKLNQAAKGKIPEGDTIAFERSAETPGVANSKAIRIPYLLKDRADVTGDDLQDAQVSIDPENRRPNVSFTLNPHGATLFDNVTKENIGHRLAIVLDNIVHSAPVIQGRIGGGRGQITLGRGDNESIMREAKDLAIVLRAGALPAQLEFLEQRVVGPSLGADSIKKGAMAAVIGMIAVFLFTGFYYRRSGVIAVVSLLMNVIFVLAILVGIEATLTLPGIAAIALTVGIAVDSNVVIYERIREELRHGKGIHTAVEAGFSKAFRTILDSNITNAAAALVLLNFGTGPIKGFAVTLLIGIVTTVFTAVFACRVMFDVALYNAPADKKLSI